MLFEYLQVNYSNNKMIEHPQTGAFKQILQSSIILNNVIKAVQDGDTSNISVEGKVIFISFRFFFFRGLQILYF